MIDLSEWLRLLSEQSIDTGPAMGGLGVTVLASLKARLEQPLRLLQRRDDQLEASMRVAVAVNHQVANAVMAAALHADALAQRAQGSALAAGLQHACLQLSRIGAMVTEVRTALSGPDLEGVERVEWRPVVEAFAERRGLALDVSGELPARVFCAQGDAGLERILEELTDNVPAGATARVEVRFHEDLQVSIAIIDDGPGPSLAIDAAREAFITDRAGAAGVGLFVVDCLAKASGARLEVTVREQGGTCAGVHFFGDLVGD